MRSKTRFTSRLYLLFGCLLALCLLLVILTLVQGPRIRLARLDSDAVTYARGQRLVLQLNRPVKRITDKDITVSPRVPVRAMSGGSTIIVAFEERLRYDTAYDISLQVDGRTLKHSFTTGRATLLYVRHGNTGDELRKRVLSTGREETVFAAATISDFVSLGTSVIVSTLNRQNTHDLNRIDLNTREQQQIQLPEPGSISNLQATPDKQAIGFAFTSRRVDETFSSTLHLYNPAADKLSTMYGFSHRPLRVSNWRFAPDGQLLLAQLLDGSVLLVNIRTGADPIPLGQYSDIGGFSRDGKSVLLEDAKGALRLNIATRKQTYVQQPSGELTYLIEITPLLNRSSYLTRWHTMMDGRYAEYVSLHGDRSQEKRLFLTERGQSIVTVEPSPNSQLAALGTSRLDDDGQPEQKIIIVDLGTGKQTATITGSNPYWQ